MGAELEPVDAEPVVAEARPLPAPSEPSDLEPWRDAGAVAVVAAGGAVAGAATIALLRALRNGRRGSRLRIGRRREKVVARRSFLIDVHVLGR